MILPKLFLEALATTVFCALLCLQSACRYNTDSNAQAELRPLETAFGVTWPTNCIRQQVASWEYRAALDGNSKNVETIAKLEVGEATFSSWRQSVAKTMQEYPGFRVPAEPRITKRFAWWNPDSCAPSRITYYYKEVGQNPSYFAKLEVYTAQSNSSYVMYVYGLRLKR